MSTLAKVFTQFPELSTPRLRLRRIRPDDAGRLFTIFSDVEAMRYYGADPLTEPVQVRRIMDFFAERFATKTGIRWGIAAAEDNILVGTCGFNRWVEQTRIGVIGYDVAKASWGKGIGTEAVRAVVEFGFGAMDLNRIQAEVIPGNIASEALLRRLGFQEEGVLRDGILSMGRFCDLRVFGLLKREFTAR